MDPDGPRYEAQAIRCRACEARDIARDDWTESKASAHGVMFAVEPVEEHTHG